jgi:hypothetical protein
MKRIFYIVFLVLASCGGASEEELPPMPEEQFVALLTDIRLLEGTYSVKFRDVTRDELAAYYIQVFQKHGVTEEEYTHSLMIYHRDPEHMMAMEEEVLRRLSVMLAGDQAGAVSILPDKLKE